MTGSKEWFGRKDGRCATAVLLRNWKIRSNFVRWTHGLVHLWAYSLLGNDNSKTMVWISYHGVRVAFVPLRSLIFSFLFPPVVKPRKTCVFLAKKPSPGPRRSTLTDDEVDSALTLASQCVSIARWTSGFEVERSCNALQFDNIAWPSRPFVLRSPGLMTGPAAVLAFSSSQGESNGWIKFLGHSSGDFCFFISIFFIPQGLHSETLQIKKDLTGDTWLSVVHPHVSCMFTVFCCSGGPNVPPTIAFLFYLGLTKVLQNAWVVSFIVKGENV